MQGFFVICLLPFILRVAWSKVQRHEVFRDYELWFRSLQSNHSLSRLLSSSPPNGPARVSSFRAQSVENSGFLLQYYYASTSSTSGCPKGEEFYVTGYPTNTCLVSEKGDSSLMLTCTTGSYKLSYFSDTECVNPSGSDTSSSSCQFLSRFLTTEPIKTGVSVGYRCVSGAANLGAAYVLRRQFGDASCAGESVFAGGRNKYCAAVGNWFLRWDFPALAFYAASDCSDPVASEQVGSLSSECSARGDDWFDPVRDDDDFADDEHARRAFVRNSLASRVPPSQGPLVLEASVTLQGLSLSEVQQAEDDYARAVSLAVAQTLSMAAEDVEVQGFSQVAASSKSNVVAAAVQLLQVELQLLVSDYTTLGYGSPEDTQLSLQQALQTSVADGSLSDALEQQGQVAGLGSALQGVEATAASVADLAVEPPDDADGSSGSSAGGAALSQLWIVVIAAGGGGALLLVAAAAATCMVFAASRHRPVSATAAPIPAPAAPNPEDPSANPNPNPNPSAPSLPADVPEEGLPVVMAVVAVAAETQQDEAEASVKHSTSAVSLSGVGASL
eukprot:gene34991-42375_t